MNTPADLSPLLEAFFTQRLIAQRKVSPHTINSYRDTFSLQLKFAERRLRCPPSKLTLENLAAPFLAAFLDHLETTRANGARTRNLRLAAIHSFFRYAALEARRTHPAGAGYPTQTVRPSFDRLSYPARNRSASEGGEPQHVDWTTRSCILADGGSNWPATLRTD
jgi:site-specific recombinase XerC